jgi:hypothetical protein
MEDGPVSLPGPDAQINVVMGHKRGAGLAQTLLQLMGGDIVPGALLRIGDAMKQVDVVS